MLIVLPLLIFTILSSFVRLMQNAFDIAVEYVHDRKQFGQAIGTFQLMQGSGLPFSSLVCVV